MRVVVTGSSGFIGTHVMDALVQAGHEGLPFDRPAHDIRDPADVLSYCQQVQAGGIINLAGQLGTSELVGVERGAVMANIAGAVHVYNAGRVLGIPVVQIGTGHRGQLNPYAITKACAEDLALCRAQWEGEQIAVVRAYHVYGSGQKPPLPHGPSLVRKIIPSFGARALAGMDLEIYGTGKQVIDLVYVTDVAQVLVGTLGGPFGEVIEAGTGVPTTVLDAAQTVLDAAWLLSSLSERSQLLLVPMRLGEPADARVVAANPVCKHPWPWKLGETLKYLQQFTGGRDAASAA